MSAITNKEQMGETIQVRDIAITPISKALKITIPGLNGGLIWNRPVAVRVSNAEGQEQHIAVVDVTRQAILFFTALSLGFVLVVSLIQLKKWKNNQGKG